MTYKNWLEEWLNNFIKISKTLYHCKIINDLVIPENVTKISSFAVCNNYELTNITLADNVTKIEYQVFL